MSVHIGNHWDVLLQDQWEQPYYQSLRKKLIHEYKTHVIYPDMHHIFRALELSDYNDLKVVIIGQDPYHGPGQANGLSFSVNRGVPIPPSLRNIFLELNQDMGLDIPTHGDLTYWAKQGVLLLNSTLTVRRGCPNSHQNLGWQQLTDRIFTLCGNRSKPIVFILWGKNAQNKKKLLLNQNHLVIESPHPSPLSASRGFFHSKPFSRANQFLIDNNIEPVDWNIV